jgi:hypothetical protein
MKKKTIKKTSKLIEIKQNKSLRAFLNEEDGRIMKKNVEKVAFSLLVAGVAAAGLMKADHAQATCSHANHGSHGSHGSHNSHASHGSHCSGGWCP